MSTTRLAASSTATKVVGSLAVLGTAAAVAGLGTYGTFTDSTTPVETSVASGTLNIDLTAPNAGIPLKVAGFVPGDVMTRTVDLKNTGDVAMSSVSLTTAVTSPANVLTSDGVNGLQLSVASCSVPWAQGGTAEAPTFTCSGVRQDLAGGQLTNIFKLSNPASLNPGGVDHIAYSISLPTTAGNEFQGKSAAMTLTFTGVQRTGSAR
ncbi:CalY family protein [Geodermatophilus sp. YIM 151500]|uniref:CalY family protein n=1 Tax=Geodermatophilus sp. YIM 151500 TaxID=2984531 RepID=UPI0021E4D0E1|nr:CalY family protein [Geodermatophilus sp. YIM 151500]MCV2491602.1 CalY family protein [Geodermatophilus sp. YIM 151500]